MIQLSDYKKQHQKAVKSLDNYIRSTYTEEEQELLAWHADKISDEHYIWKFEHNDKTVELKANLITGVVQESILSNKPKSKTPWKTS